MSPSRIPASTIESPLTRRRKSASRPSGSGTAISLLDRLLGEERATRGDLAEEGQCRRGRRRALRRLLALAADELDRAWLRRIALEQAGALEVCEVCMDGRRRGEPDGLADLPNGRRITVRVHVLGEELPDLLLSRRQHRSLQGRGWTNVCSSEEGRSLLGRRQVVGRRATKAACSSSYGVLDGRVDELETGVGDEPLPRRAREDARACGGRGRPGRRRRASRDDEVVDRVGRRPVAGWTHST